MILTNEQWEVLEPLILFAGPTVVVDLGEIPVVSSIENYLGLVRLGYIIILLRYL
jgi:hypothetical protein